MLGPATEVVEALDEAHGVEHSYIHQLAQELHNRLTQDRGRFLRDVIQLVQQALSYLLGE